MEQLIVVDETGSHIDLNRTTRHSYTSSLAGSLVAVRPERSAAKSKARNPARAALFDFAADAATLRANGCGCAQKVRLCANFPWFDLARLYAWAPGGQRAYATKPRNHGRALTVIGAIGVEGVVATMSVEGRTDGDVFRSYVAHVLAPHLRPGQVVIMDNLKAHKVAGSRELIEARGARLQYLPSYSPELSPMELRQSGEQVPRREVTGSTKDHKTADHVTFRF